MTLDLGPAPILAMDNLELARLESSLLESLLETSMAEVPPAGAVVPPAAVVPPPAAPPGDTLEGLRAEQRQNRAQQRELAKRVRPGVPSPPISLPIVFV